MDEGNAESAHDCQRGNTPRHPPKPQALTWCNWNYASSCRSTCDPLQLGLQVTSRLPSLVRIFRKTALQQTIQRRRSDSGDRRCRTFHNRCDHTGRRRALKRPLAGQHFIQHQAKREDVAAGLDFLAARLRLQLLGRHVVQRAHDLILARERHGESGAFGAWAFGLCLRSPTWRMPALPGRSPTA